MISVTLDLVSVRTAKLPTGHGHLVHGWFLDVVKQRDPFLSRWFHDGHPDKPFTISMLQGGRRPGSGVIVFPAGEACRLRLTGLDEAASGVVASFASGDIDRLVLAGEEFHVKGATSQERSFPDVVGGATRQRRQRRIGMRFVSPTAFKADRERIPLPRPELLVRKLGEKWNVYAPPQLRLCETDLSIVGSAVWIGRYDLHTEILRFPSRRDLHGHPEVGFVGECEFVVDDRAPEGACTIARSLLEFAYYAGVGHKTTMGMGQVMPLPVIPP